MEPWETSKRLALCLDEELDTNREILKLSNRLTYLRKRAEFLKRKRRSLQRKIRE